MADAILCRRDGATPPPYCARTPNPRRRRCQRQHVPAHAGRAQAAYNPTCSEHELGAAAFRGAVIHGVYPHHEKGLVYSTGYLPLAASPRSGNDSRPFLSASSFVAAWAASPWTSPVAAPYTCTTSLSWPACDFTSVTRRAAGRTCSMLTRRGYPVPCSTHRGA